MLSADAERAEEVLARGVERYAGGDVRSAAALFREASALRPGDERLRAYLAWAEARLAVEDPSAVEVAEEPPTDPDASGWLDAAETPVRNLDSLVKDQDALAAGPADSDDPMSPERRDITLTWHPVVDEPPPPPPVEPPAARGVEAPVRSFLSRTPTRPNLLPLEDVAVLSEERVATLAGARSGGATRPVAKSPTTSPEIGPGRSGAPRLPHSTNPTHPPHPEPVRDEPTSPLPRAGERIRARRTEFEGEGSGPRRLDRSDPETIRALPTRSMRASVDRVPVAHEEPEELPPLPGPDAPPAGTLVVALLRAAREAYEQGEHEAALLAAEKAVAESDGLDAGPLQAHAEWLGAVYERALGNRNRIVRMGTPPADLDPAAAFLLSRVDGTFSIDDLLDISGMERAAACRTTALLLRRGALLAK